MDDRDDGDDDERALFRPLTISGGAGPDLQARVLPGPYGRGPWDHGLLHGGPVGGLAGWAAESMIGPDEGLLCSRLTVELLSGVPLAPLEVAATVAKPGRRSRVIDVSVVCDGRRVMRATSQWILPSLGWDTPAKPPPPRPEHRSDPADADFEYPRPGFNCDAAELRFVAGSTEESGPGLIWARLTSPLMAGFPLTPLVRAATLADLAAAVGWEHGPDDASFINPDITLQLNRHLDGPWIAIEAANQRAAGGAAFNEATLADDRGPFGRVLQSLVESPNQLQSAPG